MGPTMTNALLLIKILTPEHDAVCFDKCKHTRALRESVQFLPLM